MKQEKTLLPGIVERRRRELSEEEPGSDTDNSEYENVFTIKRHTLNLESGLKSEEVCMYIKTRAKFVINFETKPPSSVNVDSKVYQLPSIPEKVNGTCVMESETAKIFIFWSGFNFSIEFIKNPEGNSYYMNRIVLVYDTKHPDLAEDFKYAARTGRVHLETKQGKNFFFTPLGKSYICTRSEDQGPLKLYNLVQNEIVGSVELWDTRFQPFVARANGKWGAPKRCLPREIRDMRTNFWPFVSAALVLLTSGLFLGVYAIKRTWFTDQKVDYGNYDEANRNQQHEMEFVRQPSEATGYDDATEEVPLNEPAAAPANNTQEARGSANPFQQKASNPFQKASNPFNN